MEIKLDSTPWHGCEYQTAQPIGSVSWDQLFFWAVETFGPVGDPWVDSAQRWYYNSSRFWFKDPQDLMLFLIKWR